MREGQTNPCLSCLSVGKRQASGEDRESVNKILESAEASIRLDLPALPLDLHFIILIKDIINSFFFFCYFFSFVNNCKFVNNNKKNGVNLPAC